MTSPTTTSGTLNWTAVTGATSYNLFLNGTLNKSGATGVNYTFSGLTSGTTYTLGVGAVNAGGQSTLTTISYTTIASAVASLKAASYTDTTANITWTAAKGATSYSVYLNNQPYASGLTTASYSLTGLTSSTTYKVGVYAVNASGTSVVSEVTFTTLPSQVTGVSAASVGETAATLSWNAVSGASSYNVYNSSKTLVASKLTSVSYNIKNLTANTTYTFYVAAVNAGGVGALIPVTFKTLPANSAGLVGKNITQTTVLLKWNAVEGAVSYNLYLDDVLKESGVKGTEYPLSGLSAGEDHKIGISVNFASGVGDTVSITVSTLQTAIIPENLHIVDQKSTSVSLEWDDQEETVSKYIIYRDNKKIGESTTNSFSDATYKNTPSVYTITAVDQDGVETGKSEEVYTEDITAPVTTATESENQIMSATISATFEDDNSGIDVSKLRWAYGEQDTTYFETNGNEFQGTSFTATRNGIYSIYAVDMKGNTGVTTIEVNDIYFTTTAGRFIQSETDLSVEAPGIPITFTRNYDSTNTEVGPFGQGWSFSFYGKLEILTTPENVIRVTLPGGRNEYFKVNNTTYSGINTRDTLKKIETGYQLTSDTRKCLFDMNGFLIGESDLNGNTISINVDASGYPKTITDSVKRIYTIGYTDGHITSITDPAERKITYSYEGNCLSGVYSVKNVLVNQYGYDSSNLLTNVKDSYGNTLYTVTYDSECRISGLKIEDEDVNYTYTLDSVGNQVINDDTTPVSYNSYGNIILGSVGTTTTYVNLYGDVFSDETTEGTKTTYTYDQYGSLITKTTVDDSGRIIELSTYNYTYFSGTETNRVKICVETDKTTAYTDDEAESTETKTLITTYDEKGNMLTYQQVGKDTDTTISNTYFSNGLVEKSTDQEGTTVTYTYDSYGYVSQMATVNSKMETTNASIQCNVIGFVLSKDTSEDLRYSYLYDNLGNVVKGIVTDTQDNVRITRYVYNNQGKILQKVSPVEYNSSEDKLVTDSNGIATIDEYLGTEAGVRYSYDPNTGVLLATQVGSYAISSDSDGNVTEVQVSGNTLASYVYTGDENDLLSSVTYANDVKLSYRYDNDGNRISMEVNEVTKYTYSYDDEGTLLSSYNVDENATTSYKKNEDGSTTATVTDDTTNTVKNIHTLSEDSSVSTDTIGAITYGLTTNSESKNDSFTYNNTEVYTKSYTMDANDTMTESKIVHSNSAILTTGYTYDAVGKITGITNTAGDNIEALTYTYDEYGNIKTISLGGVEQYRYYYDISDQLIRVDDGVKKETVAYSYDNSGNILNKSTYSYTTGSLDGLVAKDVVSYAYESTEFPDQMTSYDGKSITYDKLGNPESYPGWNMTWKAGRQLATMSNGNTSIGYTYDDMGIRTSKTVNSIKTTYTSIDGRITSQTTDTNTVYFRYDKNNQLVGFSLSGIEYVYTLNGQGDITGILDSNGNRLVTYSYDAWGKCTIVNDSSNNKIGSINPMRYRGYYLDSETGFYYLQSRYYNPDMCRFLNADDTEMLLTHAVDVIEINLFSYSNNNPINMLDKDGYSPLWAAIVNGYKFMNEVYKMYPGLVKNNDKFYTKYGFRIPDIINKKVIGEIKNVKYQALTKQIKGFLEISEKEGKQFVLVIKKGTRLSKPLVNAVKGASGIILEIGDGFVKMLSTPFFVTEDMFNIYYNSMPYSNNSRVCYN